MSRESTAPRRSGQDTVSSEPLYEELKRLYREVSNLKRERDILKKHQRGAEPRLRDAVSDI